MGTLSDSRPSINLAFSLPDNCMLQASEIFEGSGSQKYQFCGAQPGCFVLLFLKQVITICEYPGGHRLRSPASDERRLNLDAGSRRLVTIIFRLC